jgi:hypothetical protein
VHLNGRVYDPLLARFTSADPTVTDLLKRQGSNRYSYVGNDPLAEVTLVTLVTTSMSYRGHSARVSPRGSTS